MIQSLTVHSQVNKANPGDSNLGSNGSGHMGNEAGFLPGRRHGVKKSISSQGCLGATKSRTGLPCGLHITPKYAPTEQKYMPQRMARLLIDCHCHLRIPTVAISPKTQTSLESKLFISLHSIPGSGSSKMPVQTFFITTRASCLLAARIPAASDRSEERFRRCHPHGG